VDAALSSGILSTVYVIDKSTKESAGVLHGFHQHDPMKPCEIAMAAWRAAGSPCALCRRPALP
jgi:hypothetical protein